MPFWRFARELLKPEQKVVGFYDATITGVDPFPDRDYHQAPDPTLAGIERVFASAINHVLRAEIGITEKATSKSKPGYADYVKRTSAFIPLPPKKA